jgi:hypothetical protein
MFERAKTVHALGGAATVIGEIHVYRQDSNIRVQRGVVPAGTTAFKETSPTK